ncbi:hypothetical protein [Limnohabitans sp.]|uniref:hypothetical protein n=1 Tax=Limnohabitans sp. TaxID=1907725 RepID=UPI0025B85867|nr:hypothetical protein [Limnohabitans sp.]
MKLRTFIAASLSALLVFSLTACGGGGGSSTASTTGTTNPAGGSGNPGPTVGTWQGPYATNYNTRVVVLNTGETFGLYETGTSIIGALYGDMKSDGGKVSGFLNDFVFSSTTMSNANLTGNATAEKSMLINRGAQRLDLSFATNLQNPISVASLAGTYSGRGSSSFSPPNNSTLTISANGTIELPQPVCSASGSISPHPNGQNVFALNLTITGNNCGRRGNTLSGVAYLDPNNQRMFVLGLNGARTDGAFFYGLRN